MKGIKRTLYLAVIFISSFVTSQCTTDDKPRPLVKKGILDLRHVELDEKTIIPLTGDWRFYWQKLYKGKQAVSPENEIDYFAIPGTFSHKKTTSGEDLPNIGYATFHLKILLPAESNLLKAAILLPKAAYSHAIFQKNTTQSEPQLLKSRGKVGITKEDSVPDFRPSLVKLKLIGETDIYIQISNFVDHSTSGLVSVPILGSESAVRKHDRVHRQIDFTIMGVFLTVGFFMLILFALRRVEKAPLWLALFCFVNVIRLSWLKLYTTEVLPSAESIIFLHKIGYLMITLSVISYLMYLASRFPQPFKNRLNDGFVAVSWVYSVIIVAFPMSIYTRMLNPFITFILVVFLVVLVLFVKTLIIKFDIFLLLVFLGTLSIVIFAGVEIIIRLWLGWELNTVQYGILTNVLFMGFISSLNNSIARQESERLSKTLTEEVNHRRKAEEELNKVNLNLEKIVKERTGELEDVYKKLVNNAHKAGMAEIAANTLHNVGNVLNSLVTSANIIREKVINSPLDNYSQANVLLREHLDHFTDFLNKDPKGQKLLEYYLELESGFLDTFSGIIENVEQLNSKSDTITNILISQRNMLGSAQLAETLGMRDIIEDALGMLPGSFHRGKITINKSYGEIPKIPIQKSELVHALVNLFMNSFHAMQHLDYKQRCMSIELSCNDEIAWIKITDTGVGISKENIAKVFQHGFTTKKTGQGFGLHSCAKYMEEMGGKIKAESDGEGKGTTMSLLFPIKQSERVESKSVSSAI